MKVIAGHDGCEEALTRLFTETFTASDGPEEGAQIGGLVRDLLARTPAPDLWVFRAEGEDGLIGAAVFTTLRYPEDPRQVVLLSPMAVATPRQGQGLGQALIGQALDALRGEGVAVALTYGDPAFYGRVGFVPLTEAQARPPRPLSMPEGWIGQSLDGGAMPVLQGPSVCVAAMDRPDIW